MATRDDFVRSLAPVLDLLAALDLNDPAAAAARLSRAFPVDGDVVSDLGRRFVAGREGGWLCDRENAGVRYSRVQKATATAGPASFSVDAVHMSGVGPGHTHGNGEIDLCLAVGGTPRFDGHGPGWVVFPPGSWHEPTVTGGAMDILYFLPGGAIQFGPRVVTSG